MPRPASIERAVAYLPYVKGVTDVIGNLLRRRYSIKTIFRPLTQLRQLLRSPKDRDPLGVPSVYMVPCGCGKCYVGETRRNVATRLAEHIQFMKNQDVNGSAAADPFLSSGAGQYIRFDKAKVSAREKYFVPLKIREAIQISRRPNFNRDGGWSLPSIWKPRLHGARYAAADVSGNDVVSSVCWMDCSQQQSYGQQ
ncbi:uncharacterized protein LOC113233955 [Hyposmocoma kahamanoa]|uniref:uncharacterized protein LOC113233955 n=1 Tax=Hyposmocoma kahamanoa TaxID=1477025 RepID=UPI000E6D8D0B|nr:uncharacterized protein LOC113233955 [Hyposmocoma kahamanoa]